jgi:hypothetical protein
MAKSSSYDRPKLTTVERNDPAVRKAARALTTARRKSATSERRGGISDSEGIAQQGLVKARNSRAKASTSAAKSRKAAKAAQDKYNSDVRATARSKARAPKGPQGRK